MKGYRFARRSFLRGIGAGAVGLRVMLRNLEAMAQGAAAPPRFLMTHWPVGTIRYLFLPAGLTTGASQLANLTLPGILEPFKGLSGDTIVLYGLNSGGYHGFGGGHESGTPQATTGARTPGTRANGGETDDAVAGGPSWDQILLKAVPGLARPGVGYANAICDARVDSLETSTQCLVRLRDAVRGGGGRRDGRAGHGEHAPDAGAQPPQALPELVRGHGAGRGRRRDDELRRAPAQGAQERAGPLARRAGAHEDAGARGRGRVED